MARRAFPTTGHCQSRAANGSRKNVHSDARWLSIASARDRRRDSLIVPKASRHAISRPDAAHAPASPPIYPAAIGSGRQLPQLSPDRPRHRSPPAQVRAPSQERMAYTVSRDAAVASFTEAGASLPSSRISFWVMRLARMAALSEDNMAGSRSQKSASPILS